MSKLGMYACLTSTILLSTAFTACSNGSSSSGQTNVSLSIPATTYQDVASTKFAVYTNAGGGKQTLTEIDTGSDLYVIESSYAGTNIRYTGESLTILYDHGTIKRSGLVGYTSVNFLSESGAVLIGSVGNQVPVVVVPDGTISKVESQNHAIMGMRMDGNVSVRLFLPSPYNQMFMMDMPERKLIFGNFSSELINQFGLIQLSESSCDSYSVISTQSNKCWNDMHIPVNYMATYNGAPVESVFNSLFDSGADTSFQFSPLPNWLVVKDGVVVNPIAPTVNTSKGVMSIQLTDQVAAVDSNYNGGIVNAGNNLFNFYQVLYNQNTGNIGLKRIANPQTTTVPLVYKLQNESMGLHMPLMIGNNSLYVGVDTGSVGLRVLESALVDKTGIKLTSTPESYSYQDGVSLTGVVAEGPISIGGVVQTMKFMLITQVSCLPQKPNCPKEVFMSHGRAGVMGISLYIGGSTNGVWNPLPQLPNSLANGFYINGNLAYPWLTIGLNSSNTFGFDYVDLESIPQPSVNPAPYRLWNVNITADIEYKAQDGISTERKSGLVLYDTGTAAYTIYNVTAPESGIVASGKRIAQNQTLNNNKFFDWDFITGTTYYVNEAVKVADSFPLLANTGNIPFVKYDILYNSESGKMGFRTH